jgi:gas vesicle protein
MRTTGNFIMGLLVGALVGTTVTLLLTPTSGDSMRNQVKGYFDKVRTEISQAADNRRSELEKQLAELRNQPTAKEI